MTIRTFSSAENFLRVRRRISRTVASAVFFFLGIRHSYTGPEPAESVSSLIPLFGPNSYDTKHACDKWLRTGREKTYRFEATASNSVTVTLTGLTRDVDLLLLVEGAAGGCNPRNPGCLGVSANTSTDDESLAFEAEAGKTYFLVVDSYGYRTASFTLEVSCL